VTIRFSDNGRWHRYTLDGEVVKSVTTIVNGEIAKDQLTWWAAGVVAKAVAAKPSVVDIVRELGPDAVVEALRVLPDQEKKAAGRRGTYLHELAAQVVTGAPSDEILDEDIAAVIDGLVQWFDDVGFEIELGERIVGSYAHRYAGRFDVVGTMRRNRAERWLIDFKSSNSVYGDTALQCAAYARAEVYVTDGGDELPMPRIDRIGVLHIQPGIAELYDLGDIDQAFAEFLAAQVITANSKRREALVKAGPMTLSTTEAAS